MPFLHSVRAIVIKGRGTRQHLHLRKERISSRIFRKTTEQEIKKEKVGFSTGLWKVSGWALCKGQPSPKQKKSCQEHS
jgi:hypothetical protein